MAAEEPINQGAPGTAPSGETSAAAPAGGQSPLSAQRGAGDEFVDQHPEVLVGAAFAGGFALAQILKRLGE